MQPINQLLTTTLAKISQFLPQKTPGPTGKGNADKTKDSQVITAQLANSQIPRVNSDFLMKGIGVGPQDKLTRTPNGYFVQVNRTSAAPPLPPGANFESFKGWLGKNYGS